MALLVSGGLAAGSAQAAAISWDKNTVSEEIEGDPAAPAQEFSMPQGTAACDMVSGQIPVTSETGSETLTVENVSYWDTALGTESEHKCTGTFGTKPVVKTNGCKYVLHAGKTVGEMSAKETEGTLDIACEGANTITIESSGCLIKVPSQTGRESVLFQTKEIKVEEQDVEVVTLKEKMPKISYSYSGFTCGSGEGKEGVYNGNLTITGFDKNKKPSSITAT
jgi:hypothetical protein